MAHPTPDDRSSPAFIPGRGWKYRIAVEGLEPEIFADPRPIDSIRAEARSGVVHFQGVIVDVAGRPSIVGKGDVHTILQSSTGSKEEILLSLRYDDGFEEAQSYVSPDDDDDDQDDDAPTAPTVQPARGPALPPLGPR